jgi:hypothetical protein
MTVAWSGEGRRGFRATCRALASAEGPARWLDALPRYTTLVTIKLYTSMAAKKIRIKAQLIPLKDAFNILAENIRYCL